VVDNSGGSMAIDQDFGWVDRTTVVPSRGTERQEIQDLHIYVGAPIPPPVYEWMRTLGISDLPIDLAAHDFGSSAMLDEWNRELRSYRGKVFVSELGCGGMADLDEVVAGYGDHTNLCDAQEMKSFRDSLHRGFEARHLDRVFGSVRDLIQATQASQAAGLTCQIEPLMANPRVSGYIVTQLNDVAWEFHAGVLDPWRNPKPVYHALKRLTRPHCVVLKAATPVVTCGDRVDVALTLVSQDPLQGEERVRVTVRDPAGEELDSCLQPAVRGGGIRELGNISVATGQAAGEYRVSARLVSDRETLAESSEPILALPRVDLAEIAAGVTAWGETPRAIPIQEQGRAGIPRKADASEPGPCVLLAANPASLTGTDWDGLLDAVEMGRVAIVGPLHGRDEVAQRLLNDRGVNISLHLGIGNWMGCFHWVPDSELFAGLPAGGLAGEVYVDVLPWYVMSELDGEVLAGSVRNTQTRREPPAMLWYSDVEAIRLGKGTLFFCQYRVFEQADANPLAARFVSNLVQLAQAYL
jgi:beta-galactosidase